MGVHKIRRGLDLPIQGAPEAIVEDAPTASRVALVAADYVGMKPTMHVEAGDKVRRGQLLFEDKKRPGVRHTSPASGTVQAVNRGDKRAFQSVVIQLDSGERSGRPDHAEFTSYTGQHPSALSADQIEELLVESGLWTALRARPFGRVAEPGTKPQSIFVNAMDSQPLAPDVELIYQGNASDFERGLLGLAKLTQGRIYVCRRPKSQIQVPSDPRIGVEEFAGPHPAGTPGVHIHTLDPVDRRKLVWHLGLQDVIAIGRLFATGQLSVERIVSLAGPSVTRPRHLRTRIGAGLEELLEGELSAGEHRIVSGSVLAGQAAMGDRLGYLGRYHQQISVINEGRERQLLGWLTPGFGKFSTQPLFLSKLLPGKRFALTTDTNGSPRAIVPIGLYERVMPMDLMPTFLLKALVTQDLERAEELGCLELDAEDLALCTFVCPGKIDYGPYLRDALYLIEKEG